MSPISSCIVAARITPTPGRLISRCISTVTSTNPASRCSNCSIGWPSVSTCASICWLAQPACSGNRPRRDPSSARARFPQGSLDGRASRTWPAPPPCPVRNRSGLGESLPARAAHDTDEPCRCPPAPASPRCSAYDCQTRYILPARLLSSSKNLFFFEASLSTVSLRRRQESRFHIFILSAAKDLLRAISRQRGGDTGWTSGGFLESPAGWPESPQYHRKIPTSVAGRRRKASRDARLR
jgi:hypothetical protein